MNSRPLHIVILAAGQGRRMRSTLPKVLHEIGGRPLLEHVVKAARALRPDAIRVVYGCGGDQVPRALAHLNDDAASPPRIDWVEQREQRGTGHAVRHALPGIADDAAVLVLYGDVPLVSPAALTPLLEAAQSGALALLTAALNAPLDATGYGRIVRDARGDVVRIVEERDAGAEERRIREINTGILAAPAGPLRRWIDALDDDNAQGERYLTDVVALAARDGVSIQGRAVDDPQAFLGINDRVQLARAERLWQRRQAERLMRAGVTLRDPARFDLRGEVAAASDVVIDVDVILAGAVRLEEGVQIGPGCTIRDAVIGRGATILSHCAIEGAQIGAGCRVGPFARIRPQSRLEAGAQVGNFVEIKKSSVGAASKINHLAYVGDAEIGAGSNIGAGAITCNYDGARKHPTVIGNDVFVGSNVQLVAPVRVGAGATIGAGSTITRDVPPETLAVARARQRCVSGWRRPQARDDSGSKSKLP